MAIIRTFKRATVKELHSLNSALSGTIDKWCKANDYKQSITISEETGTLKIHIEKYEKTELGSEDKGNGSEV